jgi:putative RecB family exonuclease
MTNYSHSKLTCFEDCKLKYKFKYVDKVDVELPEAISLFLGKRVHEVFEKLYTDLLKEKLNSVEGLVDFYNDLWDKTWHSDVKMDPGLQQEHYKKQGERFIRDYYKTYYPFKQGRILGVETEYKLELKEDYWYHVRIDLLLEKEKGHYEIHDYKTYSKMPVQSKLEEDRQLALYSIWVRDNFKDAKKVKLIWHLVVFDKEMVTEKTVEELKELKKEILSIITDIEKEKKFEPTVSGLCNWCEYQQICPAWKHKYQTNILPANKYLKEDGVVLVNKYSEIYSKKKKIETELDKELEELKEALIKYCKEHKITTVFGSDKKISVNEYESVKIPSKGTPEREELEELLHTLKKWKEVSGLDSSALKKSIEEWSPEIQKKIEKYLQTDTDYRINIGKNEK